MSFRKERKFRLTSSGAKELKGLLLNRGMTLLFPDRKITSQYFDTPELAAFSESEEGVLPRYKIRVRWYNDDPSSMALERKVSSIEGRFKTVRPIASDEFERIQKRGVLDGAYGRIMPSARISYERSYYNYDQMRVTFDTNIRYSFPSSFRQYRDHEEVLEIKAPFEVSDDFLEQVIPVPASRFSKYARAFLHREHAI